MSPDILVEDERFLVVNKPGGLLTQAPPEIDSLEDSVRDWLRERQDDSSRPYVGIPHRLDRPASGVMIVGRDRKSTKALSSQFEMRRVEKTYWALVEGSVENGHGQWTDYLRKLPNEARSEIVKGDAEGAQFARLRYKVLLPLPTATLLEIELETGRTHQIRLQSASRFHPILGDDMYGSTMQFGPQTDDSRQRWIALHARRLVFFHPKTDQRVEVVAPLPIHWRVFSEFAELS